MSDKYNDIVTKLEGMTVVELNELVKSLEEKWGVSAAAMSAGPAAGGAVAEEKDTFTVILKSGGDQKINVIKVVREVTGLGLKESKDLVDGAPKPIKEGAKKEEAEEIKKKIEGAGGQAELQ